MPSLANNEYHQIAQQIMQEDGLDVAAIEKLLGGGNSISPEVFQQLQQLLPALETEDGPNGYWDAQKMGNGQGNSFATFRDKSYPVQEAFDLEAFINGRKKAWDEDDSGSETGFDQDTLNILIQELGNDGVASMSGNDASKAMLRGELDEEAAQMYEALSPEQRIQLLQMIVDSDGLGGFKDTIDYMMKDQTNKEDLEDIQNQ